MFSSMQTQLDIIQGEKPRRKRRKYGTRIDKSWNAESRHNSNV